MSGARGALGICSAVVPKADEIAQVCRVCLKCTPSDLSRLVLRATYIVDVRQNTKTTGLAALERLSSVAFEELRRTEGGGTRAEQRLSRQLCFAVECASVGSVERSEAMLSRR